jgi:hypothetical protein
MPLTVTPTLQGVYTLLRAFVLGVVPAGVPVVQGLGNRVPMPPPSPGFVCMTATLLMPLRTPVELWDTTDLDPVTMDIEQGTQIRVQLDCYGAASADWAIQLATLLRTDYACRALAPVAPLYADNPIQAPLTNGEEQYEQRWIVGANLQYNPVVSIPMQFADTAEVDLINVDERYPPS